MGIGRLEISYLLKLFLHISCFPEQQIQMQISTWQAVLHPCLIVTDPSIFIPCMWTFPIADFCSEATSLHLSCIFLLYLGKSETKLAVPLICWSAASDVSGNSSNCSAGILISCISTLHVLQCQTFLPISAQLWNTVSIEVNLDLGSFFSDICPLVKTSMYATRSSYEKRNTADGKKGNRNSKRKWSVFAHNFCVTALLLVPWVGKTYYSSKERETFLSVSEHENQTPHRWKLPSTFNSVVCSGCNGSLHHE